MTAIGKIYKPALRLRAIEVKLAEMLADVEGASVRGEERGGTLSAVVSMASARDEARHQRNGQRDQWHGDHPAAYQGDDQEKEQSERHIGKDEKRGRCQHPAHHLETLDLRGQRAHRGRTRLHADAHHAVEEPLGQLVIDGVAGAIHRVAAHLLELAGL